MISTTVLAEAKAEEINENQDKNTLGTIFSFEGDALGTDAPTRREAVHIGLSITRPFTGCGPPHASCWCLWEIGRVHQDNTSNHGALHGPWSWQRP